MGLTDNEIKKALEDKIEFENFDENGYAVVDIEKLKNALDLINRLQARSKSQGEKIVIQKGCIDWQAKEINRLQAENERLLKFEKIAGDTIERQGAEIERLESLSERLGDDVNWKADYIYELEDNLKTAKAEAYKEFAEILIKSLMFELDLKGWQSKKALQVTNDTLKELVGDGSGKM